MGRDRLDPVDLMLLGRMDEAAKMYLDIYVEMVQRGDRYISPLILSQLHFCVANSDSSCIPEEATETVEMMVKSEFQERGIAVDEQTLRDDIAMAKGNVVADREYSERIARRWV